MVSQLSKLLCFLTSDLLAFILPCCKLLVFQWSSMLPPCWRNSASATCSSTLVFGPVAHSDGSWHLLKDLLVRYRFSGSSNDCLSEEKTGSSFKSQDAVRALLIFSVRLEGSINGSSFISALILSYRDSCSFDKFDLFCHFLSL